jgi:hypothetical protein
MTARDLIHLLMGVPPASEVRVHGCTAPGIAMEHRPAAAPVVIVHAQPSDSSGHTEYIEADPEADDPFGPA